mmetsp:Transcript_15689/g.38634  ORF Transcript_15689/g.38634 Transcript_15689/m.38634 type:complete len:311 (-) Transcript_15689:176-1108(-)
MKLLPIITVWLTFFVKETECSFSAAKQQTHTRPELVRNALENNELIYYFGLGSNMSRKKLENRGINGTKIEAISFEAAVVPNYRLAFNMRGFPPLEPGMGSLEPCDSNSKPLLEYKSNECHGALVKLTAENYAKVMASEGVSDDQTNPGYEEVVVDAFPYGGNIPVKAVALRARPHVRLSFDPSPSKRYMNILKEGARELNLKPCYQEFLEQHPIQVVPKWQKKYVIYNLLFNRLFGRGFMFIQSRLLFLFYASPVEPRLKRILFGFISNLVLLPGFLMGFFFCTVAKLLGKEPPFLARMMKFLAASDEE